MLDEQRAAVRASPEGQASAFYVESLSIDFVPKDVHALVSRLEGKEDDIDARPVLESIEAALETSTAVVVTGEGGVGKSTAMAALAGRLPLAVHVDLRAVRHADVDLGLEHVLRHGPTRATEAEVAALRQRSAVFVLDGYDELGGRSEAEGGGGRTLAERLRLREQFPRARLVVSVRVTAVPTPADREAAFGGEVALRYVLPFTWGDTRQYVERRAEYEAATADAANSTNNNQDDNSPTEWYHYDPTAHDGRPTPSIREPAGASPLARETAVFVSKYTNDSDETAKLVYHSLEALGVPCFLDEYSIPQGKKIGEVLYHGLRPAKAVVCLVSPRVQWSKWCKMELQAAGEWGIPVLPVRWRVPDEAMPEALRGRECAAFAAGADREREAASLREVVRATLRQLRIEDKINEAELDAALAGAYRALDLAVPRAAALMACPLLQGLETAECDAARAVAALAGGACQERVLLVPANETSVTPPNHLAVPVTLREGRTLAELLLDGGATPAHVEALQEREAVFVLRGFDELGDEARQRNLADALRVESEFPLARLAVLTDSSADTDLVFGAFELGTVDVAGALEAALPEPLTWSAFAKAVERDTDLRQVLRVPLMLRLFVEVLPDLGSARRITRRDIFEAAVRRWYLREARKPGVQQLLRRGGVAACDTLSAFSRFAERLAGAMHERGTLETGDSSDETWHAVLRGMSAELEAETDDERQRFMMTSPLRVLSSGAYSFVHKSFWEYFLAVHLLGLAGEDVEAAATRAWGVREFHRAEPNVRDFLRDALMREDEGGGYALNERRREGLMRVVRRSAADESETAAIAAANAVTVLHAANHRLACVDLRGVRIRGANLATAMLDGVDLRGADMRGVSLTMASLRRAQLQETQWSGMPLGGLLDSHTDKVNSASFSSDGLRVVTASDDKTVRVWDAESGEEVRRLEGHTDGVASASFPSDGRHVVSASDDETVRVWDAESGEEVRRLEGHTKAVWSASFSSDGRRVLSASDDETVRVWDWESGEEVRRFEGHTDGVNSASFSPDGRHVVSASFDDTVRVWDAESGVELCRFQGHEWLVNSASFSPDGRHVVSASRDKTVRVWDAKSGEEVRRLEGHAEWVRSASFSPDGRHVVSGSDDQTVRVWDWESGEEVRRLEGHTKAVFSTAFSPDGRHVVSASWDKTARFWGVESGEDVRRLEGHTDQITSTCFSPDGRLVLSTSHDNTARLWDVASGGEVLRLEGHTGWVSNATFSPNGRLVVTASWDYTARVWDAQSGEEMQRLEGHDGYATSARFSPDGRLVLTASFDKTVRVWDAETGAELRQLGTHITHVDDARFSPDGRLVASKSGSVPRLWDAESGDAVGGLSEREISLQFLDRDGDTTGPDGTLRVSHFVKAVIVRGPCSAGAPAAELLPTLAPHHRGHVPPFPSDWFQAETECTVVQFGERGRSLDCRNADFTDATGLSGAAVHMLRSAHATA